ncbi:MAG: FKBP-type peptidyl-prolyl cis-trans isomerase [Bacteroidales bacterium]|jgi:FKBP-type peptidyl-prolyl cis-trans isomerase|nr:FKBP-type peptidyl-prolyl cis-trans isomerase [Bacteroidales bacterium]
MRYIISICLLVIVAVSCKNSNEKPKQKAVKPTKENWIEANRIVAEKEDELINSFINRRKDWDMTKTGLGVYYEVYEKGTGSTIHVGEKITIKYSLILLDGTVVREKSDNNIVTVEIGAGEMVKGLDKTVQLLRRGDKARVIVPSGMGYGATGNGKDIPPRAALYYDIEIGV